MSRNHRLRASKQTTAKTRSTRRSLETNTGDLTDAYTDLSWASHATSSNNRTAIPICLPDNCHWDETTSRYSTTEGQRRTSLKIVRTALEKLRAVRCPVCVVSIVGPCRGGKSYILSKLFDQGAVFPLGHSMDPETTGMWMWIVPEKFRDPTTGREFAVVLLDSEGSNAIGSQGKDDCVILTLAMLLSSIMFYNSAGVPKRRDVEEFQKIIELSERIQVFSDASQGGISSKNLFPSLIWLLRDVTLDITERYSSLKAYFEQNVFAQNPHRGSAPDLKKGLEVFKDFEACALSRPSTKPVVMRNMHKNEDRIDESFLEEVKELQRMVKSMVAPMRNFNGDFIEGDVLAMLLERYVHTLNQPGLVPCVQNAWQAVVECKCTHALQQARCYLENQAQHVTFPCDEGNLDRQYHESIVDASQLLEAASDGLLWSDANYPNYLETIQGEAKEMWQNWQRENDKWTDMFCRDKEAALRDEYLQPVVEDLWHTEAGHHPEAEMEHYDLLEGQLEFAYHTVLHQFGQTIKGNKSVCSKWKIKLKMVTNILNTGTQTTNHQQLKYHVHQHRPQPVAVNGKFHAANLSLDFVLCSQDLEKEKKEHLNLIDQRRENSKAIQRQKEAQVLERKKLADAREKKRILGEQLQAKIHEKKVQVVREKQRHDDLQRKLRHEKTLRTKREREDNMRMTGMQEELENLRTTREQERSQYESRRNKDKKIFEETFRRRDQTLRDEMNSQCHQVRSRMLSDVHAGYTRQLQEKRLSTERWKTQAANAERERDFGVAQASAMARAERERNESLRNQRDRLTAQAEDSQRGLDRVYNRNFVERLFNTDF